MAPLRLLKIAGGALLWLVILACLAVTWVPPFLDHQYYRGPVSGHFDGARFFNPEGKQGYRPPTTSARTGFGARLLHLPGAGVLPPWPDAIVVSPAKPPRHVADMSATWIGHASVLVQAGGVNILTDPVWSDVIGPLPPFGPRRLAPPGIRFEDLPKIDLILLSHNHYDHFDLPTLKRLWARDHPKIVVPLGNETILKAEGIDAVALDWGQRIAGPGGTGVTALPVSHWGSRYGVDRSRALWAGYAITTKAGNIYFAGDTGPGDMRWPTEARAHGPYRLAIIPIGAFRFSPGEMVNANHIGPREAVQAFRELGAAWALPIHWGTFRLSMEGYETPVRMLDLFERCAGIDPARFRARRIGGIWAVPPASPVETGAPTADPADCRDGSAKLGVLK